MTTHSFAALAAVTFFATALAAASPGHAQVRPPEERLTRHLVGLPLEPNARQRALETLSSERFVLVRTLPFLVAIDAPESAAARLRELPGVRWVGRDVYLEAQKRQTADCSASQWPLRVTPGFPPEAQIGVEDAWLETTGFFAGGSERVRVAVVDDGIEALHPDLIGRVPLALNLSEDGRAHGELSARDDHGTQTAGVIAAGRDGIGVDGVCPDCDLLSVRLLGDGGPTDLYQISSLAAAEAITWAIDHGAAVINNAWGPPDGNPNTPDAARSRVELPPALGDALNYAVRAGRDGLGAVVVWSAGNGGEPIAFDAYASDPRVLAVGSFDANGRRATYSDWGLALDLVTPSSGGRDAPAILTTDRTGALGRSALNEGACAVAAPCDEVCLEDFTNTFGGTSASAGHVAGAAALLIARYPRLTAAQVMEALLRSAHPLDRLGGDNGFSPRYGFGALDVAAALRFAAGYTDQRTEGFELCGNGRDDDGDAGTDDACRACVATGPEQCDGEDNDCDGFIDPGYTCQPDDRGWCATCTRSAECADGYRCRASERQPGQFCLPRCDGGEHCPEGTACRDGDVCDWITDAGTRDCYEIAVSSPASGQFEPPSPSLPPAEDESRGCAAGPSLLSWLARRRKKERRTSHISGDSDQIGG